MGVHHECHWSMCGFWILLEVSIFGLQKRWRGFLDSLSDKHGFYGHAASLSLDLNRTNVQEEHPLCFRQNPPLAQDHRACYNDSNSALHNFIQHPPFILLPLPLHLISVSSPLCRRIDPVKSLFPRIDFAQIRKYQWLRSHRSNSAPAVCWLYDFLLLDNKKRSKIIG